MGHLARRERYNVPEEHVKFLPAEGCGCELCSVLRAVKNDFESRFQGQQETTMPRTEIDPIVPRDYAAEPLDFQNPMQAWSVGKEMLIGGLWALAVVLILLMLGIGLGVVLYGNWPLRGWVW